MKSNFILSFHPESWDSLKIFITFLNPPFSQLKNIHKGLSTIRGHLQKYDILTNLTNRLIPNLRIDNEGLHENCLACECLPKKFV